MLLALAQMKMDSDPESNYKKTLQLIRRAAEKGSDMIVFPEIQLTPFFPQYPDSDVSEYVLSMDSPYIQGICDACRENHIYSSPNLYIEKNGRRYDTSLLIGDEGDILGEQKMVHIAQCDCFYEQSYYTPSEEGFKVFDTKLGKIGIVVCFDRHYPESIRTEALRGAQLIIIPTANTTAEPSELFEWEIRIQAFHSRVKIAMCNRVGKEDGMIFSGESLVVDCDGDVIAAAGAEEQLLFAEVDLSDENESRNTHPYTSLRRKELYE